MQTILKGSFTPDPPIKKIEVVTLSNAKALLKKGYRVIDCKLILRPLSDLTKEIEAYGKAITPLHELNKMRGVSTQPEHYTFYIEGENGFLGIETTTVYGCKWGDNSDFHYEKETSSFYDTTDDQN
ncbi:unnamed protein product, partial [marine sediment metagenome]